MIIMWFAYYVIANATETVSACMVRYVFNACTKRICGKVTPTLSARGCYIVSNGVVTEISKKKKYVIVDGEISDSIEENWCVL